MRTAALALALLFPVSALAAPAATSTYQFARDLALVAPARANAYYAAGSLEISGTTAGDLSAAAGTMVIGAPVAGDADLAGGIVSLRAPIAGDLRLLAARASIDSSVGGDLIALAGSLTDSAGGEKSGFIAAGTANLLGGAAGPLTIYANNVSLSGTFAGDISIVSSGRVTLAPGTIVRGKLVYEAPEAAAIPNPELVAGGVRYEGASFLPTSGESRAIALAGVGIFLLVKILGALIAAGLIAGLFPALAARAASETTASARRVVLTMLLGFALLVATPVLLIILALTFVGLGLAALIFSAYLLLATLALVYTGVMVGSALARRFAKRETILWRDAVIGMFVVCLLTVVPVVGLLCIGVLWAFATGALARIFYRFAFPREESTSPLL